VAVARRSWRHSIGGEVQRMAPWLGADGVAIVGRQRVGEHAGQRVLDWLLRGVGQRVGKEGGGQAGVALVERDERAERRQRDGAREAGVGKGQLGQWILAAKGHVGKVRQAGQVFAAWSPAEAGKARTA